MEYTRFETMASSEEFDRFVDTKRDWSSESMEAE